MYTALLFRYLGSSVLYGLGVLLMVIPINSVTLRILERMKKYENEAKDARTKRTTEAISNMKLLKLQVCWPGEWRHARQITNVLCSLLQRHGKTILLTTSVHTGKKSCDDICEEALSARSTRLCPMRSHRCFWL